MVTDEQARQAAREILSTQDYTRWGQDYDVWLQALDRLHALVPDWLLSGLSRGLEALRSLLGFIESLLARFGVLGDVAPLLGWLAVALGAAALWVLLWRWGSLRERRERERTRPSGPLSLHAQALDHAQACAREGRFLEAAHRIQLASLALLIAFDWLELARSDPNRTLRQRVGDSALPEREREELIRLVDRLETLWFDEPSEDEGLYHAWRSLDARLRSLAPRRGSA